MKTCLSHYASSFQFFFFYKNYISSWLRCFDLWFTYISALFDYLQRYIKVHSHIYMNCATKKLNLGPLCRKTSVIATTDTISNYHLFLLYCLAGLEITQHIQVLCLRQKFTWMQYLSKLMCSAGTESLSPGFNFSLWFRQWKWSALISY